ncbi:hypothetical protein [Thermus phage P23-45]|uniref:Uncharacterized protein n=1 Tax=Thermus virus P23-45 TaxID=2914006 RepID=A7XX24_BP234|nr:hypothetical protein P23p6 [Thermus phage P23-45]ABU96839.1 hypothetical protein P23p6 [Thermus phage P23-45]UYB98468.1 hypothetical protein [Thermus phage P23-45]
MNDRIVFFEVPDYYAHHDYAYFFHVNNRKVRYLGYTLVAREYAAPAASLIAVGARIPDIEPGNQVCPLCAEVIELITFEFLPELVDNIAHHLEQGEVEDFYRELLMAFLKEAKWYVYDSGLEPFGRDLETRNKTIELAKKVADYLNTEEARELVKNLTPSAS